MSESPARRMARGLAGPQAQLIQARQAPGQYVPTSPRPADPRWIPHPQKAPCDLARAESDNAGRIGETGLMRFGSSPISAFETFRDFNCGTLSSHIAIWSACSVSGFWAGLQEQSNTRDASSECRWQKARDMRNPWTHRRHFLIVTERAEWWSRRVPRRLTGAWHRHSCLCGFRDRDGQGCWYMRPTKPHRQESLSLLRPCTGARRRTRRKFCGYWR